MADMATSTATYAIYGTFAGEPMLMFFSDFAEANKVVQDIQPDEGTMLTVARIVGVGWDSINSSESVWDVYRD